MNTINSFKNVNLKNIIVDIESIDNATSGRLEGVKLSFNPIHEDKIYHKTNGNPVGFFPKDLSISLDMRGLISLTSLCLETLSSYLYNIRSKIFTSDLIDVIHSRLDDKRYIKVRVSKMFFREEEKGRYKISIAIINKGDKENNIEDTEIVNINFTKRDVIVLTNLLKKLTSSYMRETGTTILCDYYDLETEDFLKESTVMLAKVDNSVIIDQVWLHGQELLNVMYVLEELIFKLNIEQNLNSLLSFYRQVKFTSENNILYLELRKMNKEHGADPIIAEGRESYIRIPMSSKFLAALFLYLDINILRHADFEDEMDGMEILGSSKTYLGKNVKFHISTKESTLGLAVRPSKKDPNKSKIIFVGKIKEGKFTVENDFDERIDNFIKKHTKEGGVEIVPVIESFEIDLKDQWHKFVTALAIAYTKEYKEHRDFNLVKFFTVDQSPLGRFKYEFTIFSDPNNKAPAVLIIDRFKQKNKEDIFEARFRQPLFEKYVYQLLSIILTASEDIPFIDLINQQNAKDLLKYHYKSFKRIQELKKNKDIEYGIKKTDEGVLFGNFTQPNLYAKLGEQDIELLNSSAYSRLIRGYWIPFSGEKVSIGQDGYITDMFGEVNMEENHNGTLWATQLYFGTSF